MDSKKIDIDQYVDDVLKQYIEKYKITLYDTFNHVKDKNHKDLLATLLIQENLLDKFEGEKQWNPVCKITLKGINIIRSGGWIKYLEIKEEEKRLSNELIKLSIKTNKLQQPLLWLTFLITGITLFISILDYSVHRQELQLEQNRVLQTSKEGQYLEQNTKTVRPNLDSSANYATDSLGQKIK